MAEKLNILVRHADTRMYVVATVALVLFILFTVVKVIYQGYYKRLFYILFRQEYSVTSFNESNTSFINAGYYVLFGSTLSLSTMVFIAFGYDSWFLYYFEAQNVIITLLIIFASVVVYYLLKWLIYSFWGWLFEFSEHSKNYLNLFFYNQRALGLMIFPVFLMIPFVGEITRNVLIFTAISIVCISNIYAFYTFWRYTIKIKFFSHYAILYFCIFEILPLLVVWKLVMG